MSVMARYLKERDPRERAQRLIVAHRLLGKGIAQCLKKHQSIVCI